MSQKTHFYSFIVKETYLDSFGHMNNAAYLTVLEEARWDLITNNGYGLKKIIATGQGPVILDINLRFLKELRLREEIQIETQVISYENKVSKMEQKMIRGQEVCCVALFTFGLFDLQQRKLIQPTPEWLNAVGIES